MQTTKELDAVIDALRAARRSPAALVGAIKVLQETVWNSQDWSVGLSDSAAEALRELAYDLEFYVPDSRCRAEDSAYFGEDRAIEEINRALESFNEPA